MTEKPADSRGKLRALYDWLTQATPSPDSPTTPSPGSVPVRIGRYEILHKLGEGGMGVVYAARDERLGRTVALKTMSSLVTDDSARKRFWREARAAASVNHPNICQIHEIGEDGAELFLVMELLEGQPLSEKLKEGPMSPSEAVAIGLEILAALGALHANGIIHRDLKPTNVFLTRHGIKLLDFGLARPSVPERSSAPGSSSELTRTGTIVGTPGYMAPEQVTAEAVDSRCDLFAAGAILFEMLAGRPAFTGRTFIEVLHATLHAEPPALTGSPAVVAADRVIRKALAKRPADRPASAEAMAKDLASLGGASGDDSRGLARALVRLVVLPFRVLRPDPETDFLAFSLPDAIATSLSGTGSLVVRSSATAARFGGEPDLKALAAEADVDRVVMGTLLRSGDQLRTAVQLVEAPGGTILTSQTVQVPLGELFQLQDDLARRLVEALSLSLAGAGAMSAPDARAYELYLRANELARSYAGLPQARELYQKCLELDPRFAPAWARLGRCHLVIGKYVDDAKDSFDRAEEAFRRALELDPRLSIAHKFFAQLEADKGQATSAMVRLLREADRNRNDPELFAGLVHAFRYCGLYGHSIAAHEEARRLDPNIHTSVEQTLLMTGDIDRVLSVERRPDAGSGDEVIRAVGLGLAGRLEEARRTILEMREAPRIPAFQPWIEYLLAWIDRRPADMKLKISMLRSFRIMEDPEAIFEEGWLLCDVGEHERALEYLRRAIDKGYFVAPTLAGRPQFDALRGDPRFQAILADAEEGRRRALVAFREAGGERLLGR